MAIAAADFDAIFSARSSAAFMTSDLRNDTIHEAELKGILRLDHLAEEKHFHGALAANVAGYRDRRRRTEQADMDTWRTELRLFACNCHVAGGDELTSRRRGGPFDRGDDRFGAVTIARIREELAAKDFLKYASPPSSSVRCCSRSRMSCPAQKIGPLPAMTTAFTADDSESSTKWLRKASVNSIDRLLRASGRFIVRTAIGPWSSRRSTPSFVAVERPDIALSEIR